MTGDQPRLSLREQVADLQRRREEALQMGGPQKVARHRASGRLTVRERIERLIDDGSWYELGLLALPERRSDQPAPGDGVVTGFARMAGRKVCVVGIDATVLAGSTAPVSMRKQGRLLEFAAEKGLPIVLLCDADGGRIPDVMGWRFSGLPLDFRSFIQPPQGRPPVPRIAALLGPSYGDAALHAATGHFVVMTKSSAVALSGPSVVESAIGERTSDTDLGGPVAATQAGNAHLVVDNEDEAFQAMAIFLSYLPDNAALPAPLAAPGDPAIDAERLLDIVPTDPKVAYEMYDVIEAIADDASVFPWRPTAGTNVITALARMEGQSVGIVASQPRSGAGALDPAALGKEAAFIELCNTFNLPLVFLQDVPGLLIGSAAERAGILHAYEAVVSRLAHARVPKIVVVLRKAYGGGHYAMGGRPTNPDLLVCWPSAELGFMAPETGVRTVHRRELERAEAEGGPVARAALEAQLQGKWTGESAPWEAAAHISIDDVIDPRDTRRVILTGIEFAWGAGDRVV